MRRHLSYANVMATVAVFVALGGGAFALSKNSVGNREIENGSVRSQELKDDDVRAQDIEEGAVGAGEVADGSVGGLEIASGAVDSTQIADGAVGAGKIAAGAVGVAEIAPGAVGSGAIADGSVASVDVADGGIGASDVADGSLGGADVLDGSLTASDVDPTGFDWRDVPVAGMWSARIVDIGAGGTTNYGGVSGRTNNASGVIDDHVMAVPFGAVIGNIYAEVTTPLTAGQTRTIRILHVSDFGDPPIDFGLECSIPVGFSSCSTDNMREGRNGLFVVEITSTGAGLIGGRRPVHRHRGQGAHPTRR